MELLAPGFGNDVDDRTGAFTVLGVVVAGLNTELL